MTILLGDMMRTIRAEEDIRRIYTKSVNPDHWFNLWLEATGDEDIADKARAKMLLAQTKNG